MHRITHTIVLHAYYLKSVPVDLMMIHVQSEELCGDEQTVCIL